jgi:hypothetical protein
MNVHTKSRQDLESGIPAGNNQRIPELKIGELSNISCCLAFGVFFLNLILPGVGTMVAGCTVTGVFGQSLICIGCVQLCLFPCVVGWIWAQITSVYMFKAACNRDELKEIDKATHYIEEEIKAENARRKDANKIEFAEYNKIEVKNKNEN